MYMAEHLTYGFEADRYGVPQHLKVEVPDAVWQAALEQDGFAYVRDKLMEYDTRPLATSGPPELHRYVLNSRRLGAATSKSRIYREVTTFLWHLQQSAGDSAVDPKITPHFVHLQQTHKSIHNAAFDILWPDLDDERLRDLGTDVMQRTALHVGYAIKREVPHLVGANVNRRRYGMTLWADRRQQHFLAANKYRYDAEEPSIHLQESTLETRQQQYICLLGAVAIAHADELVAKE